MVKRIMRYLTKLVFVFLGLFDTLKLYIEYGKT